MKSPIAFLLAPILAACALSGPSVERQSFLVQPEHEAARVERPVGDSLRIGRVDVAPPFDERAFVYRRDQVRYETDFYNEFAADPGDMVAEAAAAWFRPSGLFGEVLSARTASFADYRLEASVSAMYVDFRNTAPAAVLSIRWRILRDRDAGLLFGLDSDERVPLPERSPRGAALAFGEALKRALSELESALKAGKP